jgi:hypothetical protein
MVAPLIIAGIGLGLGALGAGAAAVLSKSELYAVVWLRTRKHRGPGENKHRKMAEVEPFLIPPGTHGGMKPGSVNRMRDEELTVEHHRNHVPLVTEVVGRTFDSLDKAKAFQEDLASKHYKSSIIVHQAADGALDSMNPIRAMQPPAKKMGYVNSHPSFDARAEGMNTLNVSTDHPTPEWAVQARGGPYPARIMPDYDDTFSSHMWDVGVPELVVPDKYYPGTSYRYAPKS